MEVSISSGRACSPFLLPDPIINVFSAEAVEMKRTQGAEIFRQGEPCQGVYILRTGSARIAIATETGREIFSRVLGPGTILGLPATLCSQPYNFSAIALEDCALEFIESPRMLEFLRTRPEHCMEIVRLMSQELTEMNQARTTLQKCSGGGCSLYQACASEMKV